MEGSRKEVNSNAPSSVPAPAHPPWIELPWELTANILQRLPVEFILKKAQKVCTTWRNVCKESSIMWRKIHMCYPVPEICAGNLCRQVIDRSQGQLVELTLCGFGNDQLLKHIADRSSGSLQCLSLGCCKNMTGEGLVKAAKRLPLLETLCLRHMSKISGESVELVGCSCPMLKSFTLMKTVSIYRRPKESEIEALAIAKTMPQLRHLCLVNNWMTNKGLEAIVDACPHLESLHLDKCPFIDLSGDLGERCCRQIKSLKLAINTALHDYSC